MRDPSVQPDMSTLARVDQSAALPLGSPQALNYPTDNATYLRSPLPPSQWTQPDGLRQFYRLGNPQNRIAPLPANAQATIVATASGVATTIVNNAISEIVIPPTPSTVTDGLVHGDAIWELDPGYVWLREEFDSKPPAFGSGYFSGDLSWLVVGLNGPANSGSRLVGPPLLTAWEINQNSNGANSAGTMFLSSYGATAGGNGTGGYALLDHPGWKATFVFAPTQAGGVYSSGNDFTTNFLPHNRMYIGLEGNNQDSNGNNTAARPYCFLGVRYDTNVGIADTTFHLEAVSNTLHVAGGVNTQGVVFDTGIVPAQDEFYRLDIECIAVGTVTMTLSGEGVTTGPQTFAVPLYTIQNGVLAATLDFQTFGNGFMNWTTNRGFPCGAGSHFTVTAMTGAGTAYNGTYTCRYNSSHDMTTADSPVTTQTFSAPAFIWTGYPCYTPVWRLSTDSTNAVGLSKSILCCYFSLVWNFGIADATATADATQARYWT